MRKEMATLLKSALENEADRIKDQIKANTKGKTDVGSDPCLLVDKTNKIRVLELEIGNDKPIQLRGKAKIEYDSDLKIYKARVQALEKHRGQTFNLIKSQCTLTLESKMKCDSDYNACIALNDPLRLKALIEITIISQSSNKYTFAVLYDLEVGLFGFQQNKLTVDQWLERFNTKVEIGDTLGVSRDHPMALEHVAQELFGKSYDDVKDDGELEQIQTDARERYLAYIFLRQSSSDHDTMKHELENSFTMASNATSRAVIS
jgi:hypothetical protein